MFVVGLTGGIGTGKSEVARMLQELGAALINADQVGHEAYTPHSEPWQAVVEAFGEGILQPDGQINRRELGGIVFSDPEKLALLNGIMHPRMARMVAERIEEYRRKGQGVLVVEAAVLFEAGWESLVDEVWTTESPVESVVARLKERSGLSEEEVRKRIDSQLSAEERKSRANVVVENAGELPILESAVKALWNTRVKGKVEQR
jgi:dephospho-CoA kinase